MAKPVLRTLFAVVPCLLFAALLPATEIYVAPNGSASANGSIGSPLDLATALGYLSPVHPGDTIWLRGGTYNGTFTSHINGTASSPIIVRQYPGEHAIIDGGSTGGSAMLTVGGSYTWFWGFEIMSSNANRVSAQTGSWPTDMHRSDGIIIDQSTTQTGPGLKFINLVIHDARSGIAWWKEAVDSEVHGCLIYYNGWHAPDGAHGHGIYAQNQTGTKKVINNIVFSQFSHGIHAYGSSDSFLNNFDLEGNTAFSNGISDGATRNTLIGGWAPANNPTLISNYFYYPHSISTSTALKLGDVAACANLVMTDNYVANGANINCTSKTANGNTFYGALSGISPSQFSNNSYPSSRPGGIQVFVRPNGYEAGRANVTIFNWDNASTVAADLGGVLSVGQGYEIRNAQDFFGAPVVTGTFDGNPVSIPMTGLSMAAPVGWTTPDSTGPEFNVFVVLPASSGGGGGGGVPADLPGPWQQADIGSVSLAGDAGESSGTFTVSASGADIWNAFDEFHYVYQPLSGDGTIVARVASLQETDPWAKAGVMIRQSLASNSPHAMTAVTAANGVAFQRRESTGAPSLHTPGAAVGAPYWVKLVRAGNTFSGYSSADGVNWTTIGSDTIAMASNVYVGLAVTSHHDGVACTATLDNVGVNASSGGGGGGGGGTTVLRIGGEQGALTSPMAILSDGNAFGGQYIATSVANSGSASWTFTAPSSGTYYIWCRVKAVDAQHDSYYVSMDGGAEDVFDAGGGSYSPSWKWTRLNGRGPTGVSFSVNPRTFSLSAGSHTLTFRAREITPLDRIIITNDASFVPTEAP